MLAGASAPPSHPTWPNPVHGRPGNDRFRDRNLSGELRTVPPFVVLEAALMPVSLDRTDLAVLATWPELQERARFPLPSTGLADGGRLQRFGVVDRRSCRQPPRALKLS